MFVYEHQPKSFPSPLNAWISAHSRFSFPELEWPKMSKATTIYIFQLVLKTCNRTVYSLFRNSKVLIENCKKKLKLKWRNDRSELIKDSCIAPLVALAPPFFLRYTYNFLALNCFSFLAEFVRIVFAPLFL
jgi:hypothetical protein